MNFKKIFTLLVLFVSLFLVAGCNENIKSSSNIYKEDGSIDYSKDGQAYNEIEDEEITSITVFKNDWADFNTAKNSNSPIYQVIRDKMGFDVQAANSSAATWESQLSLEQASGNLPDIFITNGPDNSPFFQQLIENGDIISISDWVTEEKYPNIYKHMQTFDFLRYNLSYCYGKSWFIPTTWHLEKSLYIRKDWVNNLNGKLDEILVKEGIVGNVSEITDEIRNEWKFDTPKDLLEFYRLARAFTLYDPDNNGKDDTTGYFSDNNPDMNAWIYIAFGAGYNQFIQQADGSYSLSDISDNAMYATQFITRLIEEGYMSIDSITADNDTKQNRFINGKVGMVYAHNWHYTFASGMMSYYGCTYQEACDKIMLVEPPAGETGIHGGDGRSGYWQGFCINANMSNSRIRACLKLYDYLLSDEGYNLMQYGVEGVHYSYDASTGKYESLTKTKELNGEIFHESITAADPASLLYALVDWTMHYKLGTLAPELVERQRESEANSNFEDYPSLITNAYLDYYDSCHSLYKETISILQKNERHIVYQQQDDKGYNPKTFGWDDLKTVTKQFKQKWEDYVDKYLNAYGGDEIITEYNDYINSGKGKKVDKSEYVYN